MKNPYVVSTLAMWAVVAFFGTIGAFFLLDGNLQAGFWALIAAICKVEAILWYRMATRRVGKFPENAKRREPECGSCQAGISDLANS